MRPKSVVDRHGSGYVRTARSTTEIVLLTFNPGHEFPRIHRYATIGAVWIHFGYAQTGCILNGTGKLRMEKPHKKLRAANKPLAAAPRLQSTGKSLAVISGGAPQSPLAAGALAAIYENGKTFDAFYTSGAGGIIGMLYLAPKDMSTPQALKSVLQAGVDDRIYRWFPIPYKTFLKSGPFVEQFIKLGIRFHIQDRHNRSFERLYNDWLDLWITTLAPTDLNFLSEGLCAPVPFVADHIDFSKLHKARERILLNAYCIDDQKMENFDNQELDVKHVQAALSFPLVYSPTQIGSKLYYEGSSIDPLNMGTLGDRLTSQEWQYQNIVLVDLLGSLKPALIRKPAHIIDAFAVSILVPIVALAESNLKLFKNTYPNVKLTLLGFDIPTSMYGRVTEWSYSNLSALWKIGHDAGEKFIKDNGNILTDVAEYEP